MTFRLVKVVGLLLILETPVSGAGWLSREAWTVAWYDANDATTVVRDGTSVTNWLDKSGNDYHASQANSARQPTYAVSDPLMNNMSSIGFFSDDGETGLTTPTFTASNVYILAYYSDGVTNRFPANHYPSIIAGSGSAGRYRLAGDAEGSVFRSAGGYRWYDGGGELWVNGVNIGHAGAVLPMPACIILAKGGGLRTQPTDLGHNDVSGTRYQWNGAYSEIIFTDGTESGELRQKLEGYLAWKWGIEDSLPDGHPYRARPPSGRGSVLILR